MAYPRELSMEMVGAALRALRLEVVNESPEATEFMPPGNVTDYLKALNALGSQLGLTMSVRGDNGAVRLDHAASFNFAQVMAAIAALEQAQAVVSRPKHIEFGPGLRAAQEVFARAHAGA